MSIWSYFLGYWMLTWGLLTGGPAGVERILRKMIGKLTAAEVKQAEIEHSEAQIEESLAQLDRLCAIPGGPVVLAAILLLPVGCVVVLLIAVVRAML